MEWFFILHSICPSYIYSPFAVLYSSVMNGAGYDVTVQVATTNLIWMAYPAFVGEKCNMAFFNFTFDFSQLLIRYSLFSVGVWLKG